MSEKQKSEHSLTGSSRKSTHNNNNKEVPGHASSDSSPISSRQTSHHSLATSGGESRPTTGTVKKSLGELAAAAGDDKPAKMNSSTSLHTQRNRRKSKAAFGGSSGTGEGFTQSGTAGSGINSAIVSGSAATTSGGNVVDSRSLGHVKPFSAHSLDHHLDDMEVVTPLGLESAHHEHQQQQQQLQEQKDAAAHPLATTSNAAEKMPVPSAQQPSLPTIHEDVSSKSSADTSPINQQSGTVADLPLTQTPLKQDDTNTNASQIPRQIVSDLPREREQVGDQRQFLGVPSIQVPEYSRITTPAFGYGGPRTAGFGGNALGADLRHMASGANFDSLLTAFRQERENIVNFIKLDEYLESEAVKAFKLKAELEDKARKKQQ